MAIMKRWSAQQLADTKAYLESKNPYSWSREDHHLSLEFIIQRYMPDDSGISQERYEARLADLKARVDGNINTTEKTESAAVAEDTDFAATLKETLRTKVERHEILSLLSHFANEDEEYEQRKATQLFDFWLKNPDHFEIDADLRALIQEAAGREG